ncbi:hypothetical protein T492DRAFT_862409, partial [Pavlovales sp. CCMP2436]
MKKASQGSTEPSPRGSRRQSAEIAELHGNASLVSVMGEFGEFGAGVEPLSRRGHRQSAFVMSVPTTPGGSGVATPRIRSTRQSLIGGKGQAPVRVNAFSMRIRLPSNNSDESFLSQQRRRPQQSQQPPQKQPAAAAAARALARAAATADAADASPADAAALAAADTAASDAANTTTVERVAVLKLSNSDFETRAEALAASLAQHFRVLTVLLAAPPSGSPFPPAEGSAAEEGWAALCTAARALPPTAAGSLAAAAEDTLLRLRDPARAFAHLARQLGRLLVFDCTLGNEDRLAELIAIDQGECGVDAQLLAGVRACADELAAGGAATACQAVLK